MVVTFDHTEVENRLVSVWNLVDDGQEFIGIEAADDIRLYRMVGHALAKIIHCQPLGLFQVTNACIDTYPADPTFKRTFILELDEILEYAYKAILHHILRLLRTSVSSADSKDQRGKAVI